jgi:3-oxoacyl-[acyl-carrier protein] reductase
MRSVVVTGAARGIGKAIAAQSILDGFHVYACDKNATELEKLKDEQGAKLTTTVLDVTDHKAVSAFFSQFKNIDQRPAYLVNNAGVYPAKSILDYSLAEIDTVLAVNVKGAIYLTQLFSKPMVDAKKSAVIVNIASVAQFGGSDAVYGASKGAIAGLTRCTAFSLAPYIRVNAVAPGLVLTDMLKDVPPNIVELYRKNELVKEPIRPEDVAQTVSFLLSDKSKNYSGAMFDLNNGVYRR